MDAAFFSLSGPFACPFFPHYTAAIALSSLTHTLGCACSLFASCNLRPRTMPTFFFTPKPNFFTCDSTHIHFRLNEDQANKIRYPMHRSAICVALVLMQVLGVAGSVHRYKRRELREVPEEVFRAAKCESLDLSYNELTALLERTGDLSQLQELYLSYNELTAVPVSTGSLLMLQMLDLSNNQLARFHTQLHVYRISCCSF